MVVHCYRQVIIIDDLFDQVVSAVLVEVVGYSIKCLVVGSTPDTAHT